MALTRGDFGEYDFNRMVVLFTMKNDAANVACAISTDAMDQLEGSSRTPPATNATIRAARNQYGRWSGA